MGGGGKDVPHDSAEGFGWRHDDVHGSQRQSPPPRAHPPKLPSSSNKPTKAQNISNHQTKPNATPLKLLQTPNCFTWLQKELILSNNKAV